jgi:L-threonylcarbamoyladenylate synthase
MMLTKTSNAVEAAALMIRNGGVVAYPTESCFGLGCDPRNQTAIGRILEMKDRSRDKGLILISDCLEKLLPFLAPMPQDMLDRVQASWPGPVTWLCPASEQATAFLRGQYDSLAVRVTAHSTAARLCEVADMPLVSTSANRAGQPPLRNASEVMSTFGRAVDCIVDEPIGESTKPSKILDALTGEVIRP